jgi:hypothetical protein
MTSINTSMIDATPLTTILVEVDHQRQEWIKCQLRGRDCEKVSEGNQ